MTALDIERDLLDDGGETGRCGLGLRRLGRTLRRAIDQASGTDAAIVANGGLE